MNMTKQLFKNLLVATMVLLSLACEKMVLDDESNGKSAQETGNLTLKASMYQIVPFDTRADVNLADYFSNMCFVLYQNGEVAKRIIQTNTTQNFGQTSVNLEPGEYQLLVLAHSGKGNPTLTKPDFLQFTNAIGFSDTFYYYGDLIVTTEPQTREIAIQRATSMLRVIINDTEFPSQFKYLRCYYQGESGVFNAVTGMGGTVNSEQKVFYDVEGLTPPITLRLYTFLRNDEGKLTLQMVAHNADEEILVEKKLENIPMKNHMITEYSGMLFGTPSSENSITIKADTTWTVFNRVSF